ncbi:MAG: RHS repeat-associated core domain-containing protein [Betaproteobacteria bacterium]|nr:RHS repeat-associated core domain-containing protein [Betaproteobacteria bacterium]
MPDRRHFGRRFAVATNTSASGRRFAINLRFPGQYLDVEAGAQYNYFRDYEPAIGRYVQSDPIGLAGGINTYAYVYDSPLSTSDPQGLMGRGGRGASGGYWGRQPKPGGPQLNGNLRPGYTEQDWRCSMGGEFSNDFGCWRQCCLEHDLCFQRHRCNQSSWGGPVGSACQECNLRFLKCMVLGSPKDPCQKGCSTTFLGAP